MNIIFKLCLSIALSLVQNGVLGSSAFDFKKPIGERLSVTFQLDSKEYKIESLYFIDLTGEYLCTYWYVDNSYYSYALPGATGSAELVNLDDDNGIKILAAKAKEYGQTFIKNAKFKYFEDSRRIEVTCAIRIASSVTGFGKIKNFMNSRSMIFEFKRRTSLTSNNTFDFKNPKGEKFSIFFKRGNTEYKFELLYTINYIGGGEYQSSYWISADLPAPSSAVLEVIDSKDAHSINSLRDKANAQGQIFIEGVRLEYLKNQKSNSVECAVRFSSTVNKIFNIKDMFNFKKPKVKGPYGLMFSYENTLYKTDSLVFLSGIGEYQSVSWLDNYENYLWDAIANIELVDVHDLYGIARLEAKANKCGQVIIKNVQFQYEENDNWETIKCVMRISSNITGWGKMC